MMACFAAAVMRARSVSLTSAGNRSSGSYTGLFLASVTSWPSIWAGMPRSWKAGWTQPVRMPSRSRAIVWLMNRKKSIII
jgi:hypothetical protein